LKVNTLSTAITQCPHCRAKFRVRDEHVRAHGGLVRCGACRGIFDARAHLIEGTLPPTEADAPQSAFSPQTIIAGMPAMNPPPKKLEPAVAQADAKPQTAVAASAASAPASYATAAIKTASTEREAHSTAVKSVDKPAHIIPVSPAPVYEATATPVNPDIDAERYRWRSLGRPLSTSAKVVYGLLSSIATIALMLQAAYWFRDDIASRVPSMQPLLSTLCESAGCRVGPPKRGSELGFLSTELTADPAHKGLFFFTATLHNKGAHPVAYPSLVLTLEGATGEPISRRVFTPQQYLPANANLARGLEGGGDTEIKLYLDASSVTPFGFKVDHAYF
jgi:predicted Zn finger-like uncharacterized protein